MRDRKAGTKTVVKRKLILSDEENDSEENNTEARIQKVSGQKCTMENRINTVEQEDAIKKGCGSMSPIIVDVSDDDNANDDTNDTNYEADTDEATSPVLGRNIVTNCSRMETEKRYEGELSDSLTPDMSVKSMSGSSTDLSAKSTSGSGTMKRISAAQRSHDVEADENSETGRKQTISVLLQHTQANVRITHCALLTLSQYSPYVHFSETAVHSWVPHWRSFYCSWSCQLLTYLLTYLLHGAESFLRS
jgi:hypothetical protein